MATVWCRTLSALARVLVCWLGVGFMSFTENVVLTRMKQDSAACGDPADEKRILWKDQ